METPFLNKLLPLLLLAVFLKACSLPVFTSTPTPTPLPRLASTPLTTALAYPGPFPNLTLTAYPAPLPNYNPPLLSTASANPAPGALKTSTPAFPLSGFEPQPGDDSLKRDQVLLDLESSRLDITTTRPKQVKAILTGTLTDQCHGLRVKVTPPDSGGTIGIHVYSLFDPYIACIAGSKPFTASIPLGSFTTGPHVVMVAANYVTTLGFFDARFAPQPEDVLFTRGEVTLDMRFTRLASTGGDGWNLPAVNLQGNLPDSCHQLRIVFHPPDSENKVNLEVYSVFDPQTTCDTEMTPFQVVYPLGGGGSRSSVYVNGQYLGKFQWGG